MTIIIKVKDTQEIVGGATNFESFILCDNELDSTIIVQYSPDHEKALTFPYDIVVEVI
jgi:hypothetical protein